MKYIVLILFFFSQRLIVQGQINVAQDKYTINVTALGNSNDLSKLITEAIAAGYDDIYIPASKNWVWNTTVALPVIRRINIWGNMPKSYEFGIKIRCGNRNPAIDAQGSSFSVIKGLNFIGDGSDPTKEPACFIVYARMPDKASASNHVLSDNVIDGSFFFCCIYNIGSEESSYVNNYVSFSGSHNPSITEKNAVYIYSSEDVFPQIKTKQPRPKENSMSAVTNSNEVVKSFVKGTSVFYFGVHALDISLNINYANTPANGAFITIESIAQGINVSLNRVELTKSSYILKVNANNDVGPINFLSGSFIRSDISNVRNEVYAMDVSGTSNSFIVLNISAACNFFTTAFKPDTKLLRIDRPLKSSDINLNSIADGADVKVPTVNNSKLLINSIDKSLTSGSSIKAATAVTGNAAAEKLSGSILMPAGKTSVVIPLSERKYNRGIATSTGNHYCYIKFSNNSFTVHVSKEDKSNQLLSYVVWSE